MIPFLNRNGAKWPHTRQINIAARNHILPLLGIENTLIMGLVKHGLVKHGLVKHGLVKNGLVKHGLVKHGLVKHGLVKHGLVKHGLVKHGLVKNGLVKHGLVKHGLVKHGLVKHGLDLRADLLSMICFSTGCIKKSKTILKLLSIPQFCS
jgi:hypothetical protein